MDLHMKQDFVEKWEKYFPGAELPMVCFYTDSAEGCELPVAPKPNKRGYTCIFSQLAPARRGRPRAFNVENLGCFGAKITLGFMKGNINDMTDYVVNVERYKKNEEALLSTYKNNLRVPAPQKYLVFKRWDMLEEHDTPQVVFWFAKADAIAGLHTLANFETKDPFGVITPFGSGCEGLISYAMKQLDAESPKAVLGSMDPSMRACVKPDLLSFSVSWNKFVTMYENMDKSFLGAECWEAVRSRLARQ